MRSQGSLQGSCQSNPMVGNSVLLYLQMARTTIDRKVVV